MNIKDLVGAGKTVRFQHYQSGELWYVTDCGFEFPVPISDCGDGLFANTDKAILFMRYIRKHLAFIDRSRDEQFVCTPDNQIGVLA